MTCTRYAYKATTREKEREKVKRRTIGIDKLCVHETKEKLVAKRWWGIWVRTKGLRFLARRQ